METNIMISNHNKHLRSCWHPEQIIEPVHIVCKFFLTAPEALIEQIPYRRRKSIPSKWRQIMCHLYLSVLTLCFRIYDRVMEWWM